MRSLLLPVTCAAVLSPAPFAGNVLVVDASGGGAYTSIQDAITAAADGDTILVKTGAYGAFTVDDKALAIAGDTREDVHVRGIVAKNLAAGKTLVLVNLESTGLPAMTGIGQHGLYASDNLGRIRVEMCSLTGAGNTLPCTWPFSGWDGVYVSSSPDVAFAWTTMRGGRGTEYASGNGSFALGAGLTLYDSDSFAGEATSSCCEAASGGHGIELTDCQMFASNSTAQGAAGGNVSPSCIPCSYGGNGGSGLLAWHIPSTVHLLDFMGLGGSGGYGAPGFGCDFPDGADGYSIAGQGISTLSGSGRWMSVPNPVREGTLPPFRFSGAPGETVHLLMSPTADRRLLLGWKGVLLLRPNHPHLMTTSVGTIPAGGTLNVQLPIPVLAPGEQSSVLHVQPVFIAPNGTKQLGTPASLVILDQAF